MQQKEIATDRPGTLWLAHDLIIGLLAGTGVGSIVGLFIAARVTDNNLFTLGGAIIGAIVAILLLIRSHQRHGRFLTATVVISWVLLVLSAAFIALLINAIATFN